MKRGLRIPIRWKLLVTLLFAIAAVVGVIVIAMANVFHEDKKTYISDLVSTTTLSTAEECRAVLDSYRERANVYARILIDHDLPESKKTELLQSLFHNFPQLVAITQNRNGRELASVANAPNLEDAHVSSDDLARWRAEHPAPDEVVAAGHTVVVNSTLSPEFPTMNIYMRVSDAEGGTASVITATVRLDELHRLATRSKVLEVFLATADGTLLAHANSAKVAAHELADLRPEARALHAKPGANLTLEFTERGETFIAGFADVGLGGVIAAARIPKTAAYIASQDLLSKLANVALVLLALGAVLGLLWAALITRPLDRLTQATREIATGRFDVRVDVPSRDEIGELSNAFNLMAAGLREREEALRAAQGQLVQSEKMAAFGQLGAGIAHEVKNPLAGILGCAQVALRKAEPGTVQHTNLTLIEKETRRCKKIVDNLLRFARQEKAMMEPTEPNQVVEDSVAIVAHQLEMNGVHIEIDLTPSLPMILGNANQLQQVLMNLIINAQQAMEGTPGQVTVRTRKHASGGVEIHVRDNGPGISPENLNKIFEPFFTTKPSGHGTGLGLSVSFGIVKDHAGEIAVESALGHGTTFLVTLPAHVVPSSQEPEREAVGASA